MPGIFGVEALANFCALMTSADEYIETDLPQDSNKAWMVTKNYDIYDNLKFLLNNHDEMEAYARRGYEWAKENASQEKSSKLLYKLLADL